MKRLPNTIAIADGKTLPTVNGGSQGLQIATLEDWKKCLLLAKRAIERGTRWSSNAAATWEESLAEVAIWYLRAAGEGFPAMGRNSDNQAWQKQEREFIAEIFKIDPPATMMTPTGVIYGNRCARSKL